MTFEATYERYDGLQRLSSMTVQAILHGSAWADVMNKAKRLVLDGDVQIIHNTPTIVSGVVQGDNGTYKSAISRHDPNSQVIEQWVCDCPWHQYAFARTRQWKKLEGRVCSHVMALYMQGRSTPLDTTGEDQGYAPGKGQRVNPAGPGQMQMPLDQQVQQQQGLDHDQLMEMQQQNQIEQPMPEDTSNEPAPITPIKEDAIPQAPPVPPGNPPVQVWANPPNPNPQQPLYNQMSLWDATIPTATGQGLPPTNPVSIPGGRPPSPMNPLDGLGMPGMNTFSTVHFSNKMEFDYHYAKDPFEEWGNALLARGYNPRVMVTKPGLHLEARGGKIPVPGAEPIGMTAEGLPRYRTLDLGWHPQLQRRMNANEGGPHGSGAPEQTGNFVEVKPGMQAELRAIEPALKSAYIAIHLPGSPALHPHQLAGWVDYDDIAPHPNQTSPFAPKR
jgi:hypothetical protein